MKKMMFSRKRVPWKQKNNRQKVTTSVFVLLLALCMGVFTYAALNYFFHLSYDVDNSRGVNIEGSWTGDDMVGKEVIPGSTFELNQTITNNSTEAVYLFVRIDTEQNAYKISDLDSSWSVEKETDGVILLAYGSSAAATKVEPDETVEITGTLTLDVTNAEFAALEDSELDFSVHGCGIAVSQCENHTTPEDAYDYYEAHGGK